MIFRNDVLTGFRETVSLTRALEIYLGNADLLWTDDMIRDVDLTKASPTIPDGIRLGIPPEIRRRKFPHANGKSVCPVPFALFRSENLPEFQLEPLFFVGGGIPGTNSASAASNPPFYGAKRQELDRLHEVFNRKLEQTKGKYLNFTKPANWNRPYRIPGKKRVLALRGTHFRDVRDG